MLATPGDLPVGPKWSYEVKWDGMRLLADVSTERGLRLSSRTGRDMVRHFPELAGLASLAPDVLLDGEVVLLMDGAPSFHALSERFHRVPSAAEVAARPVTYLLFDVLRLYGVPLLDRPLSERRDTLARLRLAEVDRVDVSPVYLDGAALFAATKARGLEGVIAKRQDSVYRPGRRDPAWIKVPHRRTADCVVGGYRPERNQSSRIGGLLLGVPDPEQEGRLRFAGRVGAGAGGEATQRALKSALRTVADSPFSEPLPRPDATGAVWVEPTLTVEVTHHGWTDGHRLRQPILVRPRLDR
jgi:bifunctional non-homologous end joining protein LigD